MTEKVTILRRDELPVPLIYLASPEDLAQWYASGLLWSLEHGERALVMNCFDTGPAFGFPAAKAAEAVLRAAANVLYDHPEAESLTIFCAGGTCFKAYQFCWNFWYAEHKPEHEHEGEG